MGAQKIHCWFKSYLTNRRQMCKIGRTISQERVIRCGVPQGSTLGPLPFLLYVNDLPNCLSHSTASMFAEDTDLTTSRKTIKDIQNQLNSDLENIHTWLLTNKLTLNKEKTEYTRSYYRKESAAFLPHELNAKLTCIVIHIQSHTVRINLFCSQN